MKKSVALIVLLCCLTALFGFIRFDDDIIKKVATQLNKWAESNPQEKVYLHTDKPYYAIGDDIWFKAYVTIGGEHHLSNLSGVLNVELINDKDSVKKAIKLPLTDGLAWGDFKLTDSLAEGNYRIRAYTNYMRNAGEDYFFDRTILVGNSIANAVFTNTAYTYSALANGQQKVDAIITYTDLDGKPYAGKEVNYVVQLNLRSVAKGKGLTNQQGDLAISFINNASELIKSGDITTIVKVSATEKVTKIIPFKSTSQKTDVQFFPESGSVVNGIRTKMAFKAIGADGLGIDIKGTVIDDQNQEVAQINTQHLGMGAFIFVPQAGRTYTAKLTYPDGSEGALALPKATDDGYVLNVYNNSDPDNITVKVSVGTTTFQKYQHTEINLVAQSGGRIIYTAKNKLESQVFSTKIAKSRFPSGIAQFTLFSDLGQPLNERIVFIQNDDLLKLSLKTEKTVYAPREKVKMDIVANNKNSQPIIGSFSVSVVDETKVKVDESDECTILSSILLSSDIKGYIEKPNYYFTNISDKTKADLDVLMLTQGYRRFDWKKVMTDDFPPLAFQPEKSLNISGHLKTLGGKPLPHGKVTLFTTAGGMFLLDTICDEKGAFVFNNLIFRDSVKFVIQARSDKNRKNVEIDLDNISPQLVSKNKNSPDAQVNVNTTLNNYLLNSKKQYDEFLRYGMVPRSKMLNVVNIKDKRNVLENSTNLNGKGNADQVIKADQLSTCATLSQCLNGRLLGVIFRAGVPYSTRSMNTPMHLIVDDFPMDIENLDDLNPNDVESIEILRSVSYTSIYGSKGSGGIILITTKRGGPNLYQRYTPGLITYTPVGYYKTREFYSPRYDDPTTNARVADLRSTVYWKPNIITDKNGNATIEFFNADTKGTYKAVIEGIDDDGNIGRQVFRYKVE